jgi:hypothetical protein
VVDVTTSKANYEMTSARLRRNDVNRSDGSEVGATFRHGARSDSGAILILAMIYLLSVSVIVVALAGWAMNNLNDTQHFTSGFALQNAAGSATEVAIQNIRYSSTPLMQGANPAVSCLGSNGTPQSVTIDNGPNSNPTLNTETIAVWCSTDWEPLLSTTRTVNFWACPYSAGNNNASTCQSTYILHAVVVFDDYPSSLSAPIDGQCNVWCGSGMAVDVWDWE